jgi:bifunctional DNA-binding transcriptional regulator/antitoxin component of YhaV-PrlF toxin-antitoxin module
MGKRGTLVIAAGFRKRYGFEDGADVVQEATPEGVLIRPATTVPLRIYSDQDRAMFMLNNACSAEEYEGACQAVRAMGLEPDKIKHHPFE